MSPQLAQLMVVMAVTMAVVGLPLVVLGGVLRGRIKRFNARAVSVLASVVANERRYSTSGAINRWIHIPLVEFATQQGQPVRVTGLGQSDPVPLGTAVPLLYDPSQPNDVSFTGPRGQAGCASMFWVFGGLLLAGAIGLGVTAFVL